MSIHPHVKAQVTMTFSTAIRAMMFCAVISRYFGVSQAQAPEFKAETRLVLVDVVASDQNDQPILGLKADDFKVFEDGKAQHIRFFDPHNVTTQAQTKQFLRQLPPHVYTNVPEEDPGVIRTIVLFDTLNTPTADQAYARLEMVKFLKLLPKGQSVALFTLGKRLRMVHGFGGTSDDLLAAAEKITLEPSPLVTTDAQRQDNFDQLARIDNALGRGPSGFTDSIRQFLAENEASDNDMRVRMTVEALEVLAHGVSGYPGRKNLLWLSAAFPFSLGPNPDLPDKIRSMRNYGSVLRSSAAELAAERISVYPIDVRGLMEGGTSITGSGESSLGYTSEGIPQFSAVIDRQNTESFNTRTTMNEIASQTGGKAFYNTNGLQEAMRRSIERGASYYTLAYAPQNDVWDGKFRRLEVKVSRSAKLLYRHGYFAVADQGSRSEEEIKQMLLTAVQPGTLDSTMMPFVVQVLPPEKPTDPVRVQYVIDPRQVLFKETPDSVKHAVIDLVTVAWDDKDHDAGHTSDTLEAALSPETFQRVSQTGIRAHQELVLKPGSYHLRIGVMDRTNQNIGTVDVPITVASAETAAK
jgi:VWFA-related protein